MGAARELFEETGIDIRNELDRLKPALLRPPVTRDKHGEVACELNKKLYFYLPISDNDCWHKVKDVD
jgi:8-oxo-dGTP pyrophosphatase MutT (NUDIX family)